jgi:methionyl aminopeptidase
MLNRGKAKVDVLKDGWTVVTRDGLPSAHFEHMVAVVSGGVEVLTPR